MQDDDPGATKAEVTAQINRVRKAASRADVTPSVAVRLGAELRALLRLRGQLEAQEPITADKLARSQAAAKLRERVLDIVQACPTCTAQMIEAFGVAPKQ
jgi:hypothetical protein